MTAALATIFFMAGHFTSLHGEQEDMFLLKLDSMLEPSFAFKVFPNESFLLVVTDFFQTDKHSLMLRTPMGYEKLPTPEVLEGRVKIDSPKAALSFVRLWTSPATSGLFDWKQRYREPIRLSEFSSDLVFNWETLENSIREGPWIEGVVADGRTKIIFPKAYCYREERRFVVQRVLIGNEVPGVEFVLWVKEVVEEDGHLRRTVLRSIPLNKDSIWGQFLGSHWSH